MDRQARVAAAKNAVLSNNISIYKASRQFNIPETTIRRHCNSENNLSGPGRPRKLSEAQEVELVKYSKDMVRLGFGLTASDMIRCANGMTGGDSRLHELGLVVILQKTSQPLFESVRTSGSLHGNDGEPSDDGRLLRQVRGQGIGTQPGEQAASHLQPRRDRATDSRRIGPRGGPTRHEASVLADLRGQKREFLSQEFS